MTLKEKMESIWNNTGCRCPNHLTRWTLDAGLGEAETGLYGEKGTPCGPKRGKIKGKGYSFLPKNYGLYWRIEDGIVRNSENFSR